MRLKMARWNRTWVWVALFVMVGLAGFASVGNVIAPVAGMVVGPPVLEELLQPQKPMAFTKGKPSAASLRAAPTFGTKITFEETTELAFERAKREDKLVLVLHLSGRFGSSEMT